MRIRTWLMVLVIAGCKGGAGGLCHDATCMAGVTVTIADDGGAAGALRAGTYRIVAGTAYAETEWSCAPPAGDCAADWFTDFDDDGEAGTLSLQARAHAGGLQVDLLETRGNVWSGPEEFFIKVERDGVMVADTSFKEEYKQVTASDTCVVCLVREGDELVIHLPM